MAETFASFFVDKVFSLCHNVPASVDRISELEAFWPSLDPVFDSFNLLFSADIDRILGAVRTTTCLLDLCPSWLVKVGDERSTKEAQRGCVYTTLEKTIIGSSGSCQLLPSFQSLISGQGSLERGSQAAPRFPG